MNSQMHQNGIVSKMYQSQNPNGTTPNGDGSAPNGNGGNNGEDPVVDVE